MAVLIVFFSRADENYFGGTMRYVEVGNTEIVCQKISDLDVIPFDKMQKFLEENGVC